MGFYIKKGFNFGPIRVNLSKSGLGFSVGGKGLRLGSGPQGSYVHAGRKGLYYRKNLSNSGKTKWGLICVILILALVVWAYQNGIIVFNLPE